VRPVCLDKWSNTSEPIARRQIAENAGVTPDCPEVTQFDFHLVPLAIVTAVWWVRQGGEHRLQL
jgi:hypothetical protein